MCKPIASAVRVWVVERRLHESMCIHLALRRGRGLSVCGQGTTCVCHTTVRIHFHCPLPSRVLQPVLRVPDPLEKGGTSAEVNLQVQMRGVSVSTHAVRASHAPRTRLYPVGKSEAVERARYLLIVQR